jgi:hypothetical protein
MVTKEPIYSGARGGTGLLRAALKLDAVASGGVGALLLALGGPLADPLGPPAGFLRAVGVFLLGWAAAVWLVGARPRVAGPAAWAVIMGNLLWVAGSVALVVAGWVSLTALGVGFVLAQAAVVALFAESQLVGLRRAA